MRKEEFGTETHPLRPSSLGKLMQCPMQLFLQGDGEDGNDGANVGTCVHKAAEMLHRTLSSEGALAALKAALGTFPNMPAAYRTKAETLAAAYVADPQNQVRLEHVELPVRLDLEGGVVIRGTLDQIRDGKVWDLKTTTWCSAEAGKAEYQYQQAAYVLAARQTLGLDIQPGGMIWAAAYMEKRGRPFVPMGLTLDECRQLMEGVRRTVLDVRAGRIEARPSEGHCKWCKQPRFPLCLRVSKQRT